MAVMVLRMMGGKMKFNINIKSWFRDHPDHTVEVKIERIFEKWEEDFKASDLAYEVKQQVQRKIAEHISCYVSDNLDDKILDQISKELLEEYDFKSAIKEHMQMRVKNYLQYVVSNKGI